MPNQSLVVLGALMIFGGIILAFLALVLAFRSGRFSARGGAVIIIGPFPIILGSDKRAARALLLAIVLVASLAMLFVLQLLL